MIIASIVFMLLMICAFCFFIFKSKKEGTKQREESIERHVLLVADIDKHNRKFETDMRIMLSNFKLSMRQYVKDKVASHRQIRKLEQKLNKSERGEK